MAKEWTPCWPRPRYDPGLRPVAEKRGALAGMGMTEKQGGSDVRANVTVARPTSVDGEYTLHGHKWFTSAPMNDVFLVLAQAEGGVTCFVVPRVLPDGTRNRLDVVRLKDKLGNRSNASSELEFDGTVAHRLGDEGRGVRTIIEMVDATRLDCVLGSAVADAARSLRGVVARRPPLRLRRPARRQAADAERRRRPGGRVRGRHGRSPSGWPPRSTTSPTPTRPLCAGSRFRSRSSGCASGHPRWWRRRWSASAATGTSRSR